MPFSEEEILTISIYYNIQNPGRFLPDLAQNSSTAEPGDIISLFTEYFKGKILGYDKTEVLQAYLKNKNNPHNKFTFSELRDFFEESKYNLERDEYFDFAQIALTFFSIPENPHNTFESFLEAVDVVEESADGANCRNCFWGYLANTTMPISLEKLPEVLKKLESQHRRQPEDETKASFSDFVPSESNHISFETLSCIFAHLNLTPSQKSEGLAAFLKNPNNAQNRLTIDQLCKLIESCKIVKPSEIGEVLEAYFVNEKNQDNISFAGFCDLLKIYKVDVEDMEVFGSYLTGQKTDAAKVKRFCNIVETFNLAYDFDKITQLLKLVSENGGDFNARVLLKISQNLYPTNEMVRVQFISEFMWESLTPIDDKNIEIIREVIADLSNDVAIEFISYLKTKSEDHLNDSDMLLLLKGRAHSRYKTLNAELAISAQLKDVFTDEFIGALKEKFGEAFLEDNKISAADILSYYDLSNQLGQFRLAVKPAVMSRLARSFSINGDNMLLSQEEVGKIHQILSGNIDDLSASETAGKLISNEILCKYFREKTGEIPELDRDKEYEFDFIGTKFEERASDNAAEKAAKAEKRQELNTIFNEILFYPTEESVAGFLCTTFSLDAENVGGSEAKLHDFFKNNRKELAYALTVNPTKRAGLSTQDFMTLLSKTLIDGCNKNIGTQFNMAFRATLLDDVCDILLYNVLCDVIIAQITNSRLDLDVIGGENDPLSNPNITSYYIAPEALFSRLSSAFYQEEKKGESDSWNVIEKKLGTESRYAIFETLEEKNPGNLDKIESEAAKIATQLTLISTIGEQEAAKTQFHSSYHKILRGLEESKAASLKSPPARVSLKEGEAPQPVQEGAPNQSQQP